MKKEENYLKQKLGRMEMVERKVQEIWGELGTRVPERERERDYRMGKLWKR